MIVKDVNWHADSRGIWLDLLTDKAQLETFLKGYVKGGEYEADIHPKTKKRTLTANAYFHVLAQQIANVIGSSLQEVKRSLVLDYGVPDMDDNGEYLVAILPSAVAVEKYIEYPLMIGTVMMEDTEMTQYAVYKRTSEMNAREFGTLLDGAVYEAKSLGIETLDEIRLKDLMEHYEKHH